MVYAQSNALQANLENKPTEKNITQKANETFITALDYHERGLYEKAQSLYKEVIEMRPDFVSAHINLGNLLSKRGYPKKAEHHYLIAVKLNPKSDDATYNLGAYYLTQKDYGNAIRYFQKSVSVNPKNKSAWLNMATIYMRYYRNKPEKGLWQSARDCLGRAAKIDSNYAHIYYNFGMLHEMKNEYGIALQYYREAKRLYPMGSKNYKRTEKRMQYIRLVLKS